jgi:hypothetical protein
MNQNGLRLHDRQIALCTAVAPLAGDSLYPAGLLLSVSILAHN